MNSSDERKLQAVRETVPGGDLRYLLPGEPDFKHSIPLGDSAKAQFILAFLPTHLKCLHSGVARSARSGQFERQQTISSFPRDSRPPT